MQYKFFLLVSTRKLILDYVLKKGMHRLSVGNEDKVGLGGDEDADSAQGCVGRRGAGLWLGASVAGGWFCGVLVLWGLASLGLGSLGVRV